MPATQQVSLQQDIVLPATPDRVFAALTDATSFSAWTGGAPAVINATAGGAFSCFGGMITGLNLELVPGQRLVQAWRAKSWPEGTYSIVRFDLAAAPGGTRMAFTQSSHPAEQHDHLAEGWKKMYFEPLTAYLR